MRQSKNTPPVLDKYTLKFSRIKKIQFLLILPLSILFLTYSIELLISMQSIERQNSYSFYIYFHKLWILFIPINSILTINYFSKFTLETKITLYLKSTLVDLFLVFSILTAFIAIFYIGTNINIKVIDTIYITLLIWGIIGGRYYYKRWNEYFKGEKGDEFKKGLIENNYICILEKSLKEFKLLKKDGSKGFFTKFEENPTISKIGLFIVLPIVSGFGGSGHMQGGIPYILIAMVIFLFPYLLRETMKNITFYNFLKQIEKEENVTIYNGNIKPEDNPMEQMWNRYQ